MSGRLVGEILDNAPDDLRPAELLILVVLAEDARDTDRRSRFSDVETIAYRTRLAPGTTRNLLATLVRRGLLVRVHDRARIGRHQEYQIPCLDHARTNGAP